MRHKVLYSAEAERSVEDQLLWYEAEDERGGAELADRWLGLLERAIEDLSEHPDRHGFASENGRWMQGVTIRQLRFKPWKTRSVWRILYVLDVEAGQVTVLQVRHERRPLLFEEDTP